MAGYSSKFDEWARRSETKAKLASAMKNAWAQFTKKFPNAEKDQLYVQTNVDEKYNISAEVFFIESAESSLNMFGSDRKYWSQRMKKTLGLAVGESGRFFFTSCERRKRTSEFSDSSQRVKKNRTNEPTMK